ncbi:MAG: 30S ribosomal protein S9 [Candidatus Diapherotrites archaeon]|nr:30S ribosomal protein S9 [Candidatus Diapherotrites archaeon]
MKKTKTITVVQSKAKNKKAIARARIKNGAGSLRVNSKLIDSYGSDFTREEIKRPIEMAEKILGKNFDAGLDIDITVRGGGIIGQAEACKTAIAKGLVAWSESDDLKEEYLKYDRHMLVDDVRRKESKKAMRDGARSKPQKSYR